MPIGTDARGGRPTGMPGQTSREIRQVAKLMAASPGKTPTPFAPPAGADGGGGGGGGRGRARGGGGGGGDRVHITHMKVIRATAAKEAGFTSIHDSGCVFCGGDHAPSGCKELKECKIEKREKYFEVQQRLQKEVFAKYGADPLA